MMLKQLKRMGLLVLTCAVSLFTISLCAFAKPDWPLDTGCQSEAGIVIYLPRISMCRNTPPALQSCLQLW